MKRFPAMARERRERRGARFENPSKTFLSFLPVSSPGVDQGAGRPRGDPFCLT